MRIPNIYYAYVYFVGKLETLRLILKTLQLWFLDA